MRRGGLFLFVMVLFLGPLTVSGAGSRPTRIVSLTLGTDEILLSLVDAKRIIAVTRYALDATLSNVADRAKHVPNHIAEVGVETVVALAPDLILAARYTSADVLRQLKGLGFSVVVLNEFSSLRGIEGNIRSIGTAVGESEKAEALVSEMRRRLNAVAARVANIKNKPGLLSYDVSGWTAGKETTFDELVTLAGGRNLAAEAGITGHKKISLEMVVELNPEIMILNTWTPSGGIGNKSLRNHPALQSVSALQTGRVYGIPGKHLTTVSHFIIEGVEEMAQLLHHE